MPAADGKVQTGAVQFGDDWPGLYIAGQDALFLRSVIRHHEARLRAAAEASGQAALLEGALVTALVKYAELIERDVIVRAPLDTAP